MRSHGFTLIEMLAVLVIASLIMLLLMQSLGYVLQLRERLTYQLQRLQQGRLQAHWFHSSVNALIADYPNDAHVFNGEAKQFSGLSLAGLGSMPGLPTAIRWRLASAGGKTQLYYETPTQKAPWLIAEWSGESNGFQYLNTEGQWVSRWVFNAEKRRTPQLPQAILLTGKYRQHPFTWFVPIAHHGDSPWDMREAYEL